MASPTFRRNVQPSSTGWPIWVRWVLKWLGIRVGVISAVPESSWCPVPLVAFLWPLLDGGRGGLAAPFYQHCATIYTNRHDGTTQHTLSYPFSKNQIFKYFFGPFPGAPGDFAHHFRIPLPRYITSNFFRRFYPIFCGLTPVLTTFRLTFILLSSR